MKEKRKAYSLWDNIKYVVAGVMKWQPLVFPLTIMHGLTEGCAVFIWLYAVKWILEISMSEISVDQKISKVITLVAVSSVIELVLLVISNLSDKGSEGRMHKVEYGFALFWVSKVWNMPYVMHEDPKVQDAIFKARRAINSNDNGVAGIHYWGNQILPLVIKVALAFFIFLTFNPFVVVLILVISYIRFKLINKASMFEKEECENKVVKEAKALDEYQDTTSDFTYGKDIRLFGMQKSLYRLMQNYADLLSGHMSVAQKRYARNYFLVDLLELVQEMGIYGFLIYKVVYGSLTVADFSLYLGSAHSAYSALNMFFEHLIRLNKESLHINDFRDFIESDINEENTVKSTFELDYKACEESYGKAKESIWDKKGKYTFEFKNVSFKYPGAEKYALKDLSITVSSGEKLAVVGLNGAGKSTFVKLLCRLYEPTEGHIYLNGKDISQYDLNEYWDLIAPVFQEDESFAFSVAQNVSMKDKEEQDKEKIEKVLVDAGLGDKIKELPKGIYTYLFKVLEDDGVDMSGGQKQKLMLARALYKAAPVYVLDEPTAALDAIAEAKSYETFNEMVEGRLCVYISHRLSSTKFCDKIAMFEEGRLAEYGSHEELMGQKGKYAELFEIQAKYYREGCDLSA
ncbi:MAG: ABC transporter ATP-binding protein/permease [Lachnospiraceae bacterium]|nr:ABC transporter ATP-binding protein/permease [Lachnospiraceae bacterium]